jgi:cell division transport system permease protein
MLKTKSRDKIKIYDLQTNIFAEWLRGIKLGLVNLWRNRLLSLATILVMAIMICIFNSILAVNFITRQALTTLNEKVDIVFYLKEGTDFNTASLISSKIKEIPGVKNVEYISKDQALAIVSKTYPQTTDFLLKFNIRNPLPASLSVSTAGPENQRDVYLYLSKSPYAQYIDARNQENRTDDQKIIASTADNLIAINNFVKQLIFWIVFIFIIGGALIVINAIQLTIFTRRNEIFIMRLVGATPNFIRLPFLTEGICYAVISVILSFLLLYGAGQALHFENIQILKELGQLNLTNVFLFEVLLCALLALISSLATVEKYIKGQLSYN